MIALALVHIGVFGLFHPKELIVTPAADSVLEIEAGSQRIMLEGSTPARLRWSNQGVRAMVRGNEFVGEVVRVIPRRGSLVLSVPGRIERRFEGVLSVTREGDLTATVEMSLEIAVASVVAAESRSGAMLEALKAQAVAARSYYAAGTRHSGAFEFCDTTHCQFLRSRPEPGSAAADAAQATRGLILAFDGEILQALYSASCGGSTRPLRDAGLREQLYPYYAVRCSRCQGKPSAGHRVGMCQEGASSLAAHGANFQEILNRYYPGTSLQPAQSITLRPSRRTAAEKP